MKSNSLIIKKPWISEKATRLSSLGKYVFLVLPKSNSHEIKKAIESIYKVHIVKINTLKKVYKAVFESMVMGIKSVDEGVFHIWKKIRK